MSLANYLRMLPQYHSCETRLEERCVSVEMWGQKFNEYNMGYCPSCELYVHNCQPSPIESKNPQDIADFITESSRKNRKD